jgi:hypothetical protein
MGAEWVTDMQKQRVFQAQMLFPENGGLAPEGEKCRFSREKRDRYGFTPAKRPQSGAKRGPSMLKRSETMRI